MLVDNYDTTNQHTRSANTLGHRPGGPNHVGSERINAPPDKQQLGASYIISPLEYNV